MENPEGRGGYRFFEKMENLGRWGGGGSLVNFPPWWGYGYFLEPHITKGLVRNYAKCPVLALRSKLLQFTCNSSLLYINSLQMNVFMYIWMDLFSYNSHFLWFTWLFSYNDRVFSFSFNKSILS